MDITIAHPFLALLTAAAIAGAPGPAAPASGQVRAAADYDCGTGLQGHALATQSTRDQTAACDTAHEVSNAVANSGQQIISEEEPLTVETRGGAWHCMEYPTADKVTSYTECVNGPEKVTLGR